MYPYHNKIKSRIRNGELIGFHYAENYKNIGECLILEFKTHPFYRPIRPYKYKDYERLLKEFENQLSV